MTWSRTLLADDQNEAMVRVSLSSLMKERLQRCVAMRAGGFSTQQQLCGSPLVPLIPNRVKTCVSCSAFARARSSVTSWCRNKADAWTSADVQEPTFVVTKGIRAISN